MTFFKLNQISIKDVWLSFSCITVALWIEFLNDNLPTIPVNNILFVIISMSFLDLGPSLIRKGDVDSKLCLVHFITIQYLKYTQPERFEIS